MADEPRFDFYEKVIVASANSKLAEIDGRLSAILGRVRCDDGRWFYAVSIYGLDAGWSCYEDELQPTGEFDCRETFFDGTSIRISLDGELVERRLTSD